MPTSTSFRLGSEAKRRLAQRAEHDGVSATSLLERLIIEGIDTLEHPGIVYRGPGHDRRAAVAGGPDVWEIVARLRQLGGGEEDRIETLAAETELHPRQIRVAIEFAALHSDDTHARIMRNEQAATVGQEAAERRRFLLG